jgi:HPt (histidine-containing phosphotransfer) domain-containing protein
MTLQELYQRIGGDLSQALRVLRVEKLVDKHIRKFPKNGVVEALLRAGADLEPAQMFETAHAVKGICGNLGLTELFSLASLLSEEFRPGNARALSDSEVREKLEQLGKLYDRAAEGIQAYEDGN